jgi:tetratricopeptide (TPR) repeat protein
VVREEEPPRPSTKLSTAEALPSIAANRGIEPGKLTGLLRNELDWIVMKALEKDRTRRYETANGFAADVMRYLAGEPVQAHPPSTWYRTSKWAAKNRAPLAAGGAVVVALVLGLVGTTWGMWQARVEATARQKAQIEAESNLDLANQAVEEYLLRLSEDERLRQQDLLNLRRQLATLARGFFERLLERKRDDPTQKLAVARALYSLGVVEYSNAELAKALRYLNEAKQYFDSLPAEVRKDSTVLPFALRLSYMQLQTLNNLNDRETARSVIVEAETLVTATKGSRSPALEKEVARVRIAIANFYRDGSEYERAEQFAEQAVLGLRESLETTPDTEFRYLLVRACDARAAAQQQRLRFEQALATIAEGLQASREVARENPLYVDNLFFRAKLLQTKGLIADAQKQEAITLALAQERLGILRDLVVDHPSIPGYRADLLRSLQELGETLSDQGKHEEGLVYLVEGVTAGEKYLQRYSENAFVLENLAVCVYSQARTLLRLNRKEESLRIRIKSIELQSKLAERYPDVPRYRSTLGRYRIGLMFTYLQLNRQEEALAEGKRALDLLEDHLRRSPEDSEAQRDLGNACMNMAGLHTHRREFEEAEKYARQGLKALTRPASSPRPESWKALVAQIYEILATAQMEQKKWDLAEQSVQEGLRLADKVPAVKAELEAMNKFLQARKTKDKPHERKE